MTFPFGTMWSSSPWPSSSRPVVPGRRRARLLSALVAAVGLSAACAPALNWREFTLSGGDGLRVQFPCKPDLSARTLTWPASGQPVTVQMHRCQADGRTWVLQTIHLDSVTRVEPTLREWPAMLLANLRQAAELAAHARRQAAAAGAQPDTLTLPTVADLSPAQPVQVPHMTPSPHAQAVDLLAGPLPPGEQGSGAPTWRRVRAWHFFHGLTVFQAAVWSSEDHKPAQTSEDVTRPFFDGLHFPD
jgi:hypothetical protein